MAGFITEGGNSPLLQMDWYYPSLPVLSGRMNPAPGWRSLEVQKDVLEQGSSVQDGLQSADRSLFTNFKWKGHGGWMGGE